MSEKLQVLEVTNISKSFNKKRVVNNLSLNINEGEIWGLIGNNGTGKTTTIRMIVGLVNPDDGNIKIMGKDIKKQYAEAISHVGVAFEHQYFYEGFTAMQNMKLVHTLCRGESYLPNEILDIVGLDSKNKTKVSKYSTGMRQRMGLAFALISKPKLIILDEPANGLDPAGTRELHRLINRFAKENGITFLLSSHMLHDVERICDGVLIMKNGSVALNGYVKSIQSHYGKPLADAYFDITDESEKHSSDE